MPANANTVSAQVYQGVNLSWGIGETDYSISGVTGLFQTSDTEMKYDELEVRDQRGNVVAWVGYNPNDSCTLEYIVKDTGSLSGNAATTYPTQGAKVLVGTSANDPISGSNWIIQSVAIRRTNTDAAKVTLKAVRYKGIA